VIDIRPTDNLDPPGDVGDTLGGSAYGDRLGPEGCADDASADQSPADPPPLVTPVELDETLRIPVGTGPHRVIVTATTGLCAGRGLTPDDFAVTEPVIVQVP
jgi:hypothetical protein